MTDKKRNLAVLIDAENTSASIIGVLLEEILAFGIIDLRRVYGDWSSEHMKSWRENLLKHSLRSIDQPTYTPGKNSSDIAMVIDAMDLLYTNRYDGFCLVSSDSDFTPLAFRIREFGPAVYGFGDKKTPQAFRDACNQFVETDVLKTHPAVKSDAQLAGDSALTSLLHKAVKMAAGEDGWAALSEVGTVILAQKPEFDPRKYGHPKLLKLMKATGLFAFKGSQVLYVKKKSPTSRISY